MADVASVLRSLGLFVVAGVCEIGGGWLMWKWLRDGRPDWWGLLGGLVLVLYGVIPTLQAAHFGRVYAVYGGEPETTEGACGGGGCGVGLPNGWGCCRR
jgi:hypothetical protein